MERFLVSLDMVELRQRLCNEDETGFSEAGVRQWLREAGFEPRGNNWVAAEENLGHIRADAVDSIEPLD